jgi:phosphatidate cytidylyltransferase
MLRTRVITAVVILLVLVGMIFFAPPIGWSLFVAAIALAACWEWSRLSVLPRGAQSLYLALSGALAGAAWVLHVRAPEALFREVSLAAFVLAAAFWILVAPLWLRFKWRPAPVVAALAGWLVVWPTWFAFVLLREASPWILLATAALVWIADIAAYFAGRRFGKNKLAPAVSPGKTWEGAYGGLAAVALYGIALALVSRSGSDPLGAIFAPAAGLPAIAAMLGLAALSIVGDLLESWMKRGAGRKDSSSLLPGHGGVLDRIDALLFAGAAAYFVALALHRVA